MSPNINIFQLLNSKYLTIDTVEILAFNLHNLLWKAIHTPWKFSSSPLKKIGSSSNHHFSGPNCETSGEHVFQSKKRMSTSTSFTFFIFISYSVCSAGVRNIDFPGSKTGRRSCDVDGFLWLDGSYKVLLFCLASLLA